MPRYTYDFDPHATNPDNLKTETLTAPSTNKKYRTLMPTFAPFHTTDLVVKGDSKVLTLGKDYIPTHQFIRATFRLGKLVYGSITIINDTNYNKVTIEGRTIGDRFTTTRSVLDAYLAKNIEPYEASWESVIDDYADLPYVDVQFDFNDTKYEADIQEAIDALGSTIEGKDPKENPVYRFLDSRVTILTNLINDSTLTSHQAKTNKHGTKWFHVKALKDDGIAKDAAKLFGQTIAELTNYINQRGIVQSDLDKAVKLTGGNTLLGDLVLMDGVAKIIGMDENLSIDLSNGAFRLNSNYDINVVADSKKNSSGKSVVMQAGGNKLEVVSHGVAKNNSAMLLNGQVVLNDGNLDDYLQESKDMVVLDIVYDNTGDLQFSGKGTSASPLQADVDVKDATNTVAGIAKLYFGIDKDDATLFATTSATYEALQKTKNLVHDSIEINGKPLNVDVVLDASDFSDLSNVSNTPDAQLPISNAMNDVLKDKARIDHSHTSDEIGISKGTATQYGVLQTTDDYTSESKELALTAKGASETASEVNKQAALAVASLNNNALNITQYGGGGYLPIPALGSYAQSGHNSSNRQMCAFIESNNKVVIYRNGFDLYGERVFYSTMDILANGVIENYVATSSEYKPSNLPAGWSVKRILRGTQSAMVAVFTTADGGTEYGVILTNNTGNANKHTIALYNPDVVKSKDALAISVDGYTYIIATYISNADAIIHYVSRMDNSALKTPPLITQTEQLVFSGKDFYNNDVVSSTIKLAKTSHSTDIADEPVCLNMTTGFAINIRWNNIGIAATSKGSRIRLLLAIGSYESSSKTSKRANWSYSVTFDTETMSFEIDPGNPLPYKFLGNKYEGEIVERPTIIVGGSTNTGRNEIGVDGGIGVVFATYNESTPKAYGFSYEADSYFDSLNAATRKVHTTTNRRIEGNFGSVVGAGQDGMSLLPKNYLYADGGSVLCKYESPYTYKNGLRGLGPTNDRHVVSNDYDWRFNVNSVHGATNNLYGGVLTYNTADSWIQSDIVDNDLTKKGSVSVSKNAIIDLQNKIGDALDIPDSYTVRATAVTIYDIPDVNVPLIAYAVTSANDGNGVVKSYGTIWELKSEYSTETAPYLFPVDGDPDYSFITDPDKYGVGIIPTGDGSYRPGGTRWWIARKYVFAVAGTYSWYANADDNAAIFVDGKLKTTEVGVNYVAHSVTVDKTGWQEIVILVGDHNTATFLRGDLDLGCGVERIDRTWNVRFIQDHTESYDADSVSNVWDDVKGDVTAGYNTYPKSSENMEIVKNIQTKRWRSVRGSAMPAPGWCTNSGMFYDMDSKSIALTLSCNPRSASSDTRSSLITIDYDHKSDLTVLTDVWIHDYRASGFGVCKDFGVIYYRQHSSFTFILAYVLGKTKDEWLNTYGSLSDGETAVLHTSDVAEGLFVYFTQELPFFIGNTLYTLPKTSLDIKALFPATYSNNTFYIYASVDSGSAEYELRETKDVDNDYSVWIGQCSTDETTVTELTVSRATRLGSFRELEEHVDDALPHGLSINGVRVDKTDINLTLVENRPLLNELTIPTFKDVFENWYRFSHQGNTRFPYSQPETTTWKYDEETDSIRNTTNSATFIGLVSNTKVGDYKFETKVSSTNSDDDMIGVVAAFVKDPETGKEDTLSILAYGTDTHTEHLRVLYNYYQGDEARTLTIAKSALKKGWDEIPARTLTVTRTGTMFKFEWSDYAGEADTAGSFEMDLNDYAWGDKFKGSVQFGYCAHSQAFSTWENIYRPDEEAGAYYATQKLLRDNYSWSQRTPVITGQVNLVEQDTVTYPIPERYQGLACSVWTEAASVPNGSNNGTMSDFNYEATVSETSITFTRVHEQTTPAVVNFKVTFARDERMIL